MTFYKIDIRTIVCYRNRLQERARIVGEADEELYHSFYSKMTGKLRSFDRPCVVVQFGIYRSVAECSGSNLCPQNVE